MMDGTTFFSLLACPSCTFDPNSPFTLAANLAVAVMGLALAGVLGGLLGFMWKMAKAERGALAAARLPSRRGEGGGSRNTGNSQP